MKLFTIIFIYFNYLLIKMSVYTISDLLETGIKSDFYDGYKKEISDLADKGWIKPGPRRELTDKAKDLMRKMIPEDRWGEPLQTFRLYRGFQPEDYELNAEKMLRAYTGTGKLTNSSEFNGSNNLDAIEEITDASNIAKKCKVWKRKSTNNEQGIFECKMPQVQVQCKKRDRYNGYFL